MGPKLDELLKGGVPGDAPARERVKALALAELSQARPAGSWRGDIALLTSAIWACALAVVAITVATGNSSLAQLSARLVPVLPLLVLAAVGAVAAIAPRPQALLPLGLLAGVSELVLVVATRGEGHPSSLPAWVCTAAHLGIGAVPLSLALVLLRKSAPNPLRAVVAGLAVGTVGAIAGELACEQSWQHVLLFHGAAWLGVAAGALLISRRLTPRSWAP
jgi:hypothetical protein